MPSKNRIDEGTRASARNADVVSLILGTTSDGRRRHVVILDQDSLVRDESGARVITLR